MSLRKTAPLLVYLIHSGNLNGTERMALATLAGMRGYENILVVAPPPNDGSGSILTEARAAGHATLSFSNRGELIGGLASWFLKYGTVDLIGNGIGSSLLCYLLGRVFGVRLRQLHVTHGGLPGSYHGKKRLNNAPIGQVAVSNYVRTRLLEQGVRPERIVVIDNFLSDEQRASCVLRPAYLPSGRPIDRRSVRVAVVSRIDWIKRIDLLVDAVERHGLADFEFDIYGAGEKLDELRTRAAGRSNLRFHGFATDVRARLQHADVLLHLCPEEPFGLVVLEAFASRLVAVVPDAGGAGDLVVDRVTGFRFGANDVDDLARVLERVRETSAERLDAIAETALEAMERRSSPIDGARRYRQAFEMLRPPAEAIVEPDVHPV